MKIFKMNASDWCAAKTLDDAKLALAKTLGNGEVDKAFEDEYIENPHEVEDRFLDSLVFTDDDISATTRSFRQELQRRINKGEVFPQYFASSEY